MRSIAFSLCTYVLLSLAMDLTAAEPLTNGTVIRMVQAGVPADIILKTIRSADTFQFGMLPGDLIQLKQAGVQDEAIRAMAAKTNTVSRDAQPFARSTSERPMASSQASGGEAAPSNSPAPLSPAIRMPEGAKVAPIPAGITLCLQSMVGGFDEFVMGEMRKQEVPVTIIATTPTGDSNRPEACDPNNSYFTMTGV